VPISTSDLRDGSRTGRVSAPMNMARSSASTWNRRRAIWTSLGRAAMLGRSLAHRASTQLAAAGGRASLLGDVRAAITLFERASAVLPVEDPARLPLLPELASLFGFRQFDRAEAALDEAERTAEARRDEQDRRIGAAPAQAVAPTGRPRGSGSPGSGGRPSGHPDLRSESDEVALALAWRLRSSRPPPRAISLLARCARGGARCIRRARDER
jgi:hypothetical protein